MASKYLCCVVLVLMAATMHASPGEAMLPPTVTATPTSGPCYCDEGATTADCSNKYFDTVPNVTCETSRLLVLNLSWNNLTVLKRDAFEKLVTLQYLYLDNARIYLVPKDTFHNLKDLVKLDLSSNYIQQLHSETFGDLVNLQELRLGQNPLKVLANNVFSGLQRLTTLDLSSCGLSSISEENFRRVLSQKTTPSDEKATTWPAGLYIDVNGNPLHCNCALKDFHDLVTHSVQYDHLTCTQPEDLRGYPLHLLDSADLKCKPYEILYPSRNTTFRAPRGQNFTLSCRIANDPHLPWLKRWTFPTHGADVLKTSPRYVISYSNLWYNLTIERVIPSDEGIYMCQVYKRGVRQRMYRKVSLVVFEDLEYFTDHLATQTLDTMYLIAGVVILTTFVSLVVFVIVMARRKPNVYRTKRTVFKKNRDFMVNVPFYASSDGLMPSRSLPRRPGSEVLSWWLEYPEHLYEDIDSRHSLAHPTQPAVCAGDVLYDRDHYVRPVDTREAETSRQSTTLHTYTTVLPDED